MTQCTAETNTSGDEDGTDDESCTQSVYIYLLTFRTDMFQSLSELTSGHHAVSPVEPLSLVRHVPENVLIKQKVRR